MKKSLIWLYGLTWCLITQRLMFMIGEYALEITSFNSICSWGIISLIFSVVVWLIAERSFECKKPKNKKITITLDDEYQFESVKYILKLLDEENNNAS